MKKRKSKKTTDTAETNIRLINSTEATPLEQQPHLENVQFKVDLTKPKMRLQKMPNKKPNIFVQTA